MAKSIVRGERKGDQTNWVLLKGGRDSLQHAAQALGILARLDGNDFYACLASHLNTVLSKHSPPARRTKPPRKDVRVRQLPKGDAS